MKIANDGISKKDFEESFRNVVNSVKIFKQQQDKALAEVIRIAQATIRESKQSASSDKNGIKDTLDSKIDEVNKKIAEVKDGENGKDGLDGKDADESEVIQAVLSQIHIPEIKELSESIPTLGEPIRDALELLNGDERLRVEAINGLEEKLKELGERSLGKGGGGFSYIHMDRHIFDDETLTGTINGTNKAFTITKVPNPVGSLKVFRGGARQKLDTDFTLSGKTITFGIAPVVGEELVADFRA